MSGPNAVYDVAVIGGGVVGCAAAAYLAHAGRRVSVIERDSIGSGASGRNAGVVEHPYDAAQLSLYEASLPLLRDLGVLDGRDPAGVLLLSTNEQETRDLVTQMRSEHPELDAQFVTPEDLRLLEPPIASDVSACRLATGYPVPPREATERYAAIAQEGGCEFRLGLEATLIWDGPRCTGVRAGTEFIAADAVLVAAGAAACAVVDPGGEWSPIRPSWGVAVELTTEISPQHVLLESSVALSQIGTLDHVSEHAFSLIPVAGRPVLGSTFLPNEPNPRDWESALLERGRKFVPALSHAAVRGGLACPRPRSLDGRPLLGRIPSRERLFIAAGHGGRGITLGAASARLVVEAMFAESDAAIPEPLRAARFPLAAS